MLNETQFSITLMSTSSIIGLKEVIATQTGVLLHRQRLIFRGKVLKDEDTMSTYAIEDGHTLHLVVRPLGQNASTASSAPSTTASSTRRFMPPAFYHTPTSPPQPTQSSNRSSASRTTRASASQNNHPRHHNPDHTGTTAAASGSRMAMGATITVMEGSGAELSRPMIESIMSRFMSSVSGAMQSTSTSERSSRPTTTTTTTTPSATGNASSSGATTTTSTRRGRTNTRRGATASHSTRLATAIEAGSAAVSQAQRRRTATRQTFARRDRMTANRQSMVVPISAAFLTTLPSMTNTAQGVTTSTHPPPSSSSHAHARETAASITPILDEDEDRVEVDQGPLLRLFRSLETSGEGSPQQSLATLTPLLPVSTSPLELLPFQSQPRSRPSRSGSRTQGTGPTHTPSLSPSEFVTTSTQRLVTQLDTLVTTLRSFVVTNASDTVVAPALRTPESSDVFSLSATFRSHLSALTSLFDPLGALLIPRSTSAMTAGVATGATTSSRTSSRSSRPNRTSTSRRSSSSTSSSSVLSISDLLDRHISILEAIGPACLCLARLAHRLRTASLLTSSSDPNPTASVPLTSSSTSSSSLHVTPPLRPLDAILAHLERVVTSRQTFRVLAGDIEVLPELWSLLMTALQHAYGPVFHITHTTGWLPVLCNDVMARLEGWLMAPNVRPFLQEGAIRPLMAQLSTSSATFLQQGLHFTGRPGSALETFVSTVVLDLLSTLALHLRQGREALLPMLQQLGQAAGLDASWMSFLLGRLVVWPLLASMFNDPEASASASRRRRARSTDRPPRQSKRLRFETP